MTFNLHSAIGVHAFVTTQIRKLCVALETDLASEGFDAAMDMRMLFQSRTRGKCFSTFWTGMTSGAHVIGANVTLQIARIREDFIAIFARKSPEFSMDHLVTEQIGSPGKRLWAVFALVRASLVAVGVNHMIIQPEKATNIVCCCLLTIKLIRIYMYCLPHFKMDQFIGRNVNFLLLMPYKVRFVCTYAKMS